MLLSRLSTPHRNWAFGNAPTGCGNIPACWPLLGISNDWWIRTVHLERFLSNLWLTFGTSKRAYGVLRVCSCVLPRSARKVYAKPIHLHRSGTNMGPAKFEAVACQTPQHLSAFQKPILEQSRRESGLSFNDVPHVHQRKEACSICQIGNLAAPEPPPGEGAP